MPGVGGSQRTRCQSLIAADVSVVGLPHEVCATLAMLDKAPEKALDLVSRLIDRSGVPNRLGRQSGLESRGGLKHLGMFVAKQLDVVGQPWCNVDDLGEEAIGTLRVLDVVDDLPL